MASKPLVVVFFGGRSTEHDVSCRSAAFLFRHLDRQSYDVAGIGIGKDGTWWLQDMKKLMTDLSESVTIQQQHNVAPESWLNQLLPRIQNTASASRDIIVFPIIHGTTGEDGSLQGFLDLAEVAYVGPDTLGSAIGMNKLVSKLLAAAAGVKIVPYCAYRRQQWEKQRANICQEATQQLGFPLFVKPASLGSSVGISKVSSANALESAIDAAFAVDEQILLEKGMNVREIEYAALGGYEPQISVAGEVVAKGSDFYSFDEKYAKNSKAEVLIPAPLTPAQFKEGQALALKVFQALQLYGMSRIDFFLTKDTNEFYFNEVNTIPGFTSISQYPQLWRESGLEPAKLLDRLLSAAVERRNLRRALQRTR